jgi:hypothetical protein
MQSELRLLRASSDMRPQILVHHHADRRQTLDPYLEPATPGCNIRVSPVHLRYTSLENLKEGCMI